MRMLMMLAGCLMVAGVEAAVVAGPKGGKLLENQPPRAEFRVNEARKVEVRFYDEALQPVAAAGQVVNVIAEAGTGKVKLALRNEAGALVTEEALPEGDGYTIVVQIKATPDSPNQNFRIVYHAELCGECNLAEYACTCEHAADDGHGH